MTTAANVNEITNLEEVLDTCDLPQDIPFLGDKGYQSKRNNDILKQRKLKSRLMKRNLIKPRHEIRLPSTSPKPRHEEPRVAIERGTPKDCGALRKQTEAY
jgi:IS5 family transposase